MRKQILASFALAGALAAVAAGAQSQTPGAQPAPAAPYMLKSESRLWVTGTSTVRDYNCKATAIDGAVDATGAAGSVAEFGKAVQDVKLEIPVAAMSCGNGTMEGHMRKALKADQNPVIRFELETHEIAAGKLTMTGVLEIAGVRKPTTLTAEVTEEGGAFRVRGAKQLKMTEFGVKPPSLMMGTMKVKDEVVVHYDLLLNR